MLPTRAENMGICIERERMIKRAISLTLILIMVVVKTWVVARSGLLYSFAPCIGFMLIYCAAGRIVKADKARESVVIVGNIIGLVLGLFLLRKESFPPEPGIAAAILVTVIETILFLIFFGFLWQYRERSIR